MTINPAEVNMSRAPPSLGIDSSMTSVAPILSEREVQGTLESPFCSDALRRETDAPCPTSTLLPAFSTTSPAYDGKTQEKKELEEVKPVLPPPPRADQPPRPPNAWILYRSERLRAIAAGEPIPGLLAVLEAQSLVRALDVSDQRNHAHGSKESSSSPEPNRFQLFKDAEPPTPPSDKGDTEDPNAEGGSKYRRALLQADISKVISMMWKREGKEVKSKYEAMAEARKLEVVIARTSSVCALQSLMNICFSLCLPASTKISKLQVSANEKRGEAQISRAGKS